MKDSVDEEHTGEIAVQMAVVLLPEVGRTVIGDGSAREDNAALSCCTLAVGLRTA